MKIDQIEPKENHYILIEEPLEKIEKESAIILTEGAQEQTKDREQAVYKILCVAEKEGLYKKGERVFISSNALLELIKVGGSFYGIVHEDFILGKVKD